jgi:hypothetical protein
MTAVGWSIMAIRVVNILVEKFTSPCHILVAPLYHFLSNGDSYTITLF